MATLRLEDQDPDETLDHVLDWEEALDGDTIATATWINIDAALTKVSESNTTLTHTIRLACATAIAGEEYKFTSRVVTAGGEQIDQRAKIKIRNG